MRSHVLNILTSGTSLQLLHWSSTDMSNKNNPQNYKLDSIGLSYLIYFSISFLPEFFFQYPHCWVFPPLSYPLFYTLWRCSVSVLFSLICHRFLFISVILIFLLHFRLLLFLGGFSNLSPGKDKISISDRNP